jgi:hypothetical protein
MMLLGNMPGLAAHRRSLRLIQSALVCATIALTACSEINAPSEPVVSGEYELDNIAGNAVPTTIYEGPFDWAGQQIRVTYQVHHGSLELDGNGYTLFVIMLMTGDGIDMPIPYVDTGTFTSKGTQITFRSDDAGYSFTGIENTNGTVSVTLDLAGAKHPLTYQFRK